MAFKDTNGATSVDGENFASAMNTGYLQSAPDSTPFQRSLGHIQARLQKLASQGNNYIPYDENEAGFTD